VRLQRLFPLLLVCLLLTACMGGRVERLSASDPAATGRMLTDLATARVVFIGEFHDQRDHHNLQMEIIKGLFRQGKPLAIGFEMFDLEKQPLLDDWVRGKVPLEEFVARYQKGWNIDWAEYDAIMLFARNNNIPMVALDAPAVVVRMVNHTGSRFLTPEIRKRLPAGVTTEISPSYRGFMSRAFDSHNIPEAMFENFCAAQGLRNSVMSRRIVSYLADKPERTMVVIAGVGHAMRRAVPSAVDAEGFSTRVVIPRVEGLYSELSGDDMDYFVQMSGD
jgi:uncharacterized iron-regulated protein